VIDDIARLNSMQRLVYEKCNTGLIGAIVAALSSTPSGKL